MNTITVKNGVTNDTNRRIEAEAFRINRINEYENELNRIERNRMIFGALVLLSIIAAVIYIGLSL